jgi:phosphoribosylaminoimidazole carboxylase (NCAIR synthetase)
MSKNRTKTKLVHKKGTEILEISREKATGKLFIKNTDIEVPENKVIHNKALRSSKSNYDFSKPSQAQDLGDEWSDYAWGANDF